MIFGILSNEPKIRITGGGGWGGGKGSRRRRKRKKETESLFKEIMTENFPNLGSKWMSSSQSLYVTPILQSKIIFCKTHYNETIKCQKPKTKKES